MINRTVYKDYREMSVETARQIARIIQDKPEAMLCFPAGDTSLGTFGYLAEMQKNGQVDFSRCKIVGLDEWVHLGEMKTENCYHFLKKHLFDAIGINQENLCFFDGEAADLQQQCMVTDQFIKTYGGIDMMLLGVGMNGHLGLNEPGTSEELYSHVVDLDETTRTVAQKYFTAHTNLNRGITLGLKHVMETGTVILQLSGSKKSPIVKRLLETEPSTSFPASLIKNHRNAYLLTDAEASQF